MPGVGGIEATRRIAHSSPHIAILVLAMLADDDSGFCSPARGRPRLPPEGRGAGQAEIVRADQTVAEGGGMLAHLWPVDSWNTSPVSTRLSPFLN